MKFGKTFASHQIPEWATHYMNYKHLKKIVKSVDGHFSYVESAPTEVPELVSSSLSQFFFELDRDIERVCEFYNTKFAEYTRRTQRIVQVLGYSEGKVTLQADSVDELDEMVSILLELRAACRNLKWFGELNHKGFVKILKKLDKKLSYITTLVNDHLRSDSGDGAGEVPKIDLPTNNKDAYLATRVDALPFANGIDLGATLETLGAILAALGDQQTLLGAHEGGPAHSVEQENSVSASSAGVAALRIGLHRNRSFDSSTAAALDDAISRDDGKACAAQLHSLSQKHLLSLLNKATLASAFACIDELFSYIVANFDGENSTALADPHEISGRNFFHQHVVSLGKRQLSKEQRLVPGEPSDITRLIGNSSGPDGSALQPVSVSGLGHILEKLAAHDRLRPLLFARDNYHRTPLHYAAQYGTKDVAQKLLEYLQKWELADFSRPIDDPRLWGDHEGLTPLHLAIIGKHPKTCHVMVSFAKVPLASANLLLLATRLGCVDIVQDFIGENAVDINHTDAEYNHETALYIAAKMDSVALVRFLLANGADPEMGEAVFGWTPIFAAAAEGLLEVVRELKNYGAKYNLADGSGWLPMEHAALRGHLAAADELAPPDANLLLYNIDNPAENTPRKSASAANSPFMNPTGDDALLSTSSIDKLPESNRLAVSEVYRQFKSLDNGSSHSVDVVSPNSNSNSNSNTNGNGNGNGNGIDGEALTLSSRSRSPVNRRKMKPIKSFGHRYLGADEHLVLITLGTTDTRDKRGAVELAHISRTQSFFTELDTALSLVVTCRHRQTHATIEEPVVVDLPLEDQHGSATDPLLFSLRNHTQVADVYITFDIVPTYQYPQPQPQQQAKPKVLGRGVAFLESVYSKVGANLRSLNSEVTVPLLEHASMAVLGHVRFEYMCVAPLVHPSMSISRSDTYWKQLVSTRVIGHRGLGKNMNHKSSLQLGENTVESFIAAASLGASYVEFDVQLTKDFVPVIYHDFLVAESGGDIPMHLLTAEQFLGFSEHEENGKAKPYAYDKVSQNGNVSKNFALDDELLGKFNRPRSMSSYPSAPNMSTTAEDDALDLEFRDQMARRMKLTKTWKEKGFKGNARGSSIASNFVTLKELFKRLPKNVGFNIELKYPMLDEAQHESMGEFAFDMNFYVDTILKVVYDENTSGRDILFSSFHPDICVLLSLKQPTMPILFLTEAGTSPMADIRASSLQNAIRFAKKWNLLGIVSAAETLVKTPRLAQVVKSSGLVCVTYGVQNNDPEACKIQMKAGVDAVIADSVLAVRQGLRSDEGKEPKSA